MLFIYTGIGVLLLLTIISLIIYNRLVASRNLALSALADIDANLQKRSQLIPQLVQIARGYSLHEQQVFAEIASARTIDPSSKSLDISQYLNNIDGIKEDYPVLKADKTFEKLMTQIREVEDHLLYSRQFYNGVVEEHNTRILSFPNQYIARPMGLKKIEYIQASSQQPLTPIVHV